MKTTRLFLLLFILIFSKDYAQESIRPETQLRYRDSLISSYEQKGFIYFYISYYDSAINAYNKTDSIIVCYLHFKALTLT